MLWLHVTLDQLSMT